MLYSLENEFIKISAHPHGGELHNLISKKENTEFLWNGNPQYWKYHSPILFPIVGKVKDGKYRVSNETYELPQHGLARISEFEVVEKEKDFITFSLKWDKDTLKVYPYKFELLITYTLIKNSVKVTYTVRNLDDKKIYFSVGAHPAFLCPIMENETMDDYYFEFNEKENAKIMLLASGGLFIHEKEDYLKNEDKIHLSKELFSNDALVFSDLKSTKISLKSKNHNKSLTMDYTGFPYLGLWSIATGAPFVCIEPWCGHADFIDFDGELKDKPGIVSLEENGVFERFYTLTVTE